ncbi:MAG: hypothetical protein OH338_02720 [Candidatus Parvarchaeota archaeon]|nr:hypothetical protein [Candidatus Parvarchaeota archaeon]MCW1294730.1 hypothetical protein [Candidatus Parvarchaeum tengchongense]MCW1295098.1 hypothetical protein [Candidatus Parvarchaeum tengchongense]MCW1312319.1 hypothetical protein [Candidatus Parvarchaeum tengchongense]
MIKKTLYLYFGVALIIAALVLYFGFFRLSVQKPVSTIPSKPSTTQIYTINYSINNDSYVSKDINFTFTSFFSPWNKSSEFLGNAYNNLIFIPTATNQSNPFELSRPVYLQFLVNATNLSLSQTRSQVISDILQLNSNANYTVKNITISGFNGNEIEILNSSFINTTYFAFTVNNNTLYSFVLFSSNYTLTGPAVNAFSEMLKTVSIHSVN